MIQINNHNITDIEIDGHIITTIDIIVNGQSRRVFNKIAPSHTLEIVGPSQQIEGETVQLGALYDGMALPIGADPIWELRNLGPGFEDTIDNYGLITIDPNNPDAHPLEVFCTYNGLEASFNVTVLYVAGSSTTTTTETTTDPNTGESSTSTTTVINNQDGSSTSTTETTITDSGGNVVGTSQSETNTASDGSSSTTTTNYDANGDPTSGSNNTVDTQGNSNTQTLEYNNGVPYVNGYTIDTSNNPNGGETLPSGGIDTGFIAFDGRPFIIHLNCKINPTEQNAAGSNIFFAALEPNGNKYAGFCVELYKRNQIISMASTSGGINNNGFGSRVTGSINGTSGKQLLDYVKTNGGVQTLTIDVTYTPSSYSPQYKYIIKAVPLYTSATGTSKRTDANSQLDSNSGYLPTALANATITIGTFDVEHTHDIVNMEVLEFTVTKL